MTRRDLVSAEDAISSLQADSVFADVIRDAYLDADVVAAARRFRDSAEFADVMNLIGEKVENGRLLDIGAGTGIASYAFARAGAREVYALEPDPSRVVGRGAISTLVEEEPKISSIGGVAEAIPLATATVDVVYGRQVLHHVDDLVRALHDCRRVLRPGGFVLIAREHVAENESDLEEFLKHHPVHQLTGGEHAYRLQEYAEAFAQSGLRLDRVLGPWDCVMNAYPAVRTHDELARYPEIVLEERLGSVGELLSRVSALTRAVKRRVQRAEPGALYSFFAVKETSS